MFFRYVYLPLTFTHILSSLSVSGLYLLTLGVEVSEVNLSFALVMTRHHPESFEVEFP